MGNDELRLKSVAGTVAGAVLGVVSAVLGSSPGTVSYVLAGLYVIMYPVSVILMRLAGRLVGFKKGVSVFYSIEFIVWAGVYEALSYASMMR